MPPEGTSWELFERMLSYMIETFFLKATTNVRFNAETQMVTMAKDNAVQPAMVTSLFHFGINREEASEGLRVSAS